MTENKPDPLLSQIQADQRVAAERVALSGGILAAIHAAKVDAGERAVIEHFRRLGSPLRIATESST